MPLDLIPTIQHLINYSRSSRQDHSHRSHLQWLILCVHHRYVLLNKDPLDQSDYPMEQQLYNMVRYNHDHVYRMYTYLYIYLTYYYSIARALWDYKAHIPSEVSFNAHDNFAILNKQPDGWWYAELLDPQKPKRGLVPGNYMTP
ncbi:hypothetical protein BDB01DRAFT_808381, partial [Pilobolus umbonatus]